MAAAAVAASAEHKSKFIDFRRRRSVHIALYNETHKNLKKALVEHDLSMQEMFQRFSELVIAGDKRATRIVEDLERDKRSGNIVKPKKIDNRSADTIYDIIAAESQISTDMEDEDDDDI